MITACRKEKSTTKDVRLTMKQFVESLRKKDNSLVRKIELAMEKRGKKLERTRTETTDTDNSVSSTSKSNNTPLSTPTSSPPLSPRLFLVTSAATYHSQAVMGSPLLELIDDISLEDDSSHDDDWGQFTIIE